MKISVFRYVPTIITYLICVYNYHHGSDLDSQRMSIRFAIPYEANMFARSRSRGKCNFIIIFLIDIYYSKTIFFMHILAILSKQLMIMSFVCLFSKYSSWYYHLVLCSFFSVSVCRTVGRWMPSDYQFTIHSP
jgi:hypothetical protein